MTTEPGDSTKNREDEATRAADSVAPADQGEPSEQEITEAFKSQIREFIKSGFDSGLTFKEIEDIIREWPDYGEDTDKVIAFEKLRKQTLRSGTAKEYFKNFPIDKQEGVPVDLEVLAEFGSTERSYYEQKFTKGGVRVVLNYKPGNESYIIVLPDIELNSEKSDKAEIYDSYFFAGDIPEFAKEALDRTIESASPGDDAVDVFKKAEHNLNEIESGEGFEKDNAERVQEAFERLEERFVKVREVQAEMQEKYGDKIPEQLKRAIADKRAGIMADWRQEFQAIKTKDQQDKDRAEIGRLHKSIEEI